MLVELARCAVAGAGALADAAGEATGAAIVEGEVVRLESPAGGDSDESAVWWVGLGVVLSPEGGARSGATGAAISGDADAAWFESTLESVAVGGALRGSVARAAGEIGGRRPALAPPSAEGEGAGNGDLVAARRSTASFPWEPVL